MKIILGTSRSGTTFYYNWFLNEFNYTVMPVVQNQGETFTPGYSWKQQLNLKKLTTSIIKQETEKRLLWLTGNVIVKEVFSKKTDMSFWKAVKSKPVSLVERKNKMDQVLSYGFAKKSNIWIQWDLNDAQSCSMFTYKRSWFDELVTELVMYKEMKKTWFENIEEILYYENIPNYAKNGRLPIKQSTESSLQYIKNADAVCNWYNELMEKINE